MTLNELKPGESATIDSFSNKEIGYKLITMGILPGDLIKMIRRSPLGGAVCFQLDNQRFALRNNEAECIVLK